MAGFLEMLQAQLGGHGAQMAGGMPPAPLPSVPGTSVAPPGEGGPDLMQMLKSVLGDGGGTGPAIAGAPPLAPMGGPVPPGIPNRPGIAGPPDPQKKPSSGITAADVQRFVKNFTSGAAAVDPTRSPLGALMQGAAGAAKGYDSDRESDVSKATAADDKRYSRGVASRTEARLDAKEAREAGTSRASQSKIAAEISKLNAETIKALDPTLTVDQRINMERLVRDNENTILKRLDQGLITEAEAKAETERARTELPTRVQSRPVRVTSPEDARNLPPGTKIILPDGRPGVVPAR